MKKKKKLIKDSDHVGKKAIFHGREYTIVKIRNGQINCSWKEKDGTPKGDTYINLNQLPKFK